MNRGWKWMLVVTSALSIAVGAVRAEKKVVLCHLPPGRADAPQTISVGEPSVAAHLAHGDRRGTCATGCPASCDDGNLCTSDSCGDGGECVHAPVSCDDGLACTRDACDPAGGCLRLPNDGASCDDGNGCTNGDACAGTECRGAPIAGCCARDLDCADGDSCTDDACFSGACRSTPRSCPVENKCLAGFCNAGSGGSCDTVPVSCDDANVCTEDGCDPTFGCTHSPTLFPPEPFEVSCADGADNDCDGAVDGADPDCPRCGDGVVQEGEECDDGNENPFDGCDLCRLVDITPD